MNVVPRKELYEGILRILRIPARMTALYLAYLELMPNRYTNCGCSDSFHFRIVNFSKCLGQN